MHPEPPHAASRPPSYHSNASESTVEDAQHHDIEAPPPAHVTRSKPEDDAQQSQRRSRPDTARGTAKKPQNSGIRYPVVVSTRASILGLVFFTIIEYIHNAVHGTWWNPYGTSAIGYMFSNFALLLIVVGVTQGKDFRRDWGFFCIVAVLSLVTMIVVPVVEYDYGKVQYNMRVMEAPLGLAVGLAVMALVAVAIPRRALRARRVA